MRAESLRQTNDIQRLREQQADAQRKLAISEAAAASLRGQLRAGRCQHPPAEGRGGADKGARGADAVGVRQRGAQARPPDGRAEEGRDRGGPRARRAQGAGPDGHLRHGRRGRRGGRRAVRHGERGLRPAHGDQRLPGRAGAQPERGERGAARAGAAHRQRAARHERAPRPRPRRRPRHGADGRLRRAERRHGGHPGAPAHHPDEPVLRPAGGGGRARGRDPPPARRLDQDGGPLEGGRAPHRRLAQTHGRQRPPPSTWRS